MKKNFKAIIKVANIIEESRLGGPQMRMCLVAERIKKLKQNKKILINFIFPKKDSKQFSSRCSQSGIDYIIFPFSKISRNWFSIIKYILFYPFEIIMLAILLKKNSYDIVHVSGGSKQTKGIIAAKLANIKVIWEMNDTYAPLIFRILYYLINSLADNIVYASHRSKNYYKGFIFDKKKNYIISSPVNTEFFNPYKKFQSEPFINKIKKKKIIIGTVANVSPVKDLKLFIQLAEKLSSYINKVCFIIVGSVHNSQIKYYKELLDYIKKKNLKNIFFVGPRADVRFMLSAFSIYVCSSKSESSPLSILEAMSMNKAIVTTNVGDVKIILKNKINSFVINNRNSHIIAKHIEKLILNKKLRTKFGKLVRRIALKNFDLNICAKKHFKMYDQVFNS